MQAEWELSKENFKPLKRGRKEVCKEERSLCQKEDPDNQRRQATQLKCPAATLAAAVMTAFVVGVFGKNLRRILVMTRWRSGSGEYGFSQRSHTCPT